MDLAVFAAALTTVGVGLDQLHRDKETFSEYRTQIQKELDGVPNASDANELDGFNTNQTGVPRIQQTEPVLDREDFIFSQNSDNTSVIPQTTSRPYVKNRKDIWRHRREVVNPFTPMIGNARDYQPHISRHEQADRVHIKRTDLVDSNGLIVQSEATGVERIIPQSHTERLLWEQDNSRAAHAHRAFIPKTNRTNEVEHDRVFLQNQYQSEGATVAKNGEVFITRCLDYLDRPQPIVRRSAHEKRGNLPIHATRKNRDTTMSAWKPTANGRWKEERPRVEDVVFRARRGPETIEAWRGNYTVPLSEKIDANTLFNKGNIRSQSKRAEAQRPSPMWIKNPSNRNTRPSFRQEFRDFDRTVDHDRKEQSRQLFTDRQTSMEVAHKTDSKLVPRARIERFGGTSRGAVMYNRSLLGSNEMNHERTMVC